MWRVNALMTQSELANKAGVHQSAIARIESGQQAAGRLKTMAAIANALGVKPEQIEEFRPIFMGKTDPAPTVKGRSGVLTVIDALTSTAA